MTISGQPRQYLAGFSECEKWFLSRYDIDVYLHSWVDKEFHKYNFFDEGKLQSISNYGGTVAYAFGSVFGFVTYAKIFPLGKWGVTGVNATVSVASADYGDNDKQYTTTHSLLLFYTKPFQINRRLTLSPDLYISGSPVTYGTKDNQFTVSNDMMFLTGCSMDYAITKRFKFNTGLRTSLSTNPNMPMLVFAVIGSKVNL